MAFEQQRQVYGGATVDQAVFDEGLRRHMLRVYNYMTGALAVTGVVAYVTLNVPAVLEMVWGVRWIIMLASLGVVFFFVARIHKMSFATAQTLFWVYAAMVGLWMSLILVQYTGVSIARVFFITAGAFAGTSLVGYTTKKDLSGWGSFLFIGLIGIILAIIVNIFLQSAALHFAISVIGVLIFAGLTAYDTQKIKTSYAEHFDHETLGKLAIQGALMLYLDFLNMFIFLLHLFGGRN